MVPTESDASPFNFFVTRFFRNIVLYNLSINNMYKPTGIFQILKFMRNHNNCQTSSIYV